MVLVVGKASTTSISLEPDIVVEMGESKGEWGETEDDPLGFVSSTIVLQDNTLSALVLLRV